MSVSGTLQTGLYKISNVGTTKYVNLADGNKSTPLTSLGDGDVKSILFTVALLSNDNYSVTSQMYPGSEAFAANVPKDGDVIVARSDDTQWSVVEQSTSGTYTVSPVADNTLFWSFVANDDGTKLKLTKTVDDKSKWKFTLKK